MSPALSSRTARPVAPAVRTLGVALALALGLSACGTGFRAQTYQERTLSDSTNEAIGALAIRHVRVLPPPSDGVYPVGSDARIALYVINEGNEADRLVSATAEGATSVEVLGPDGQETTLEVPGRASVSQYSLALRGLTSELRTGEFIRLELTFRENGTEAMLIPVELTGTPGPRREGYHPAETDSNGDVIVEEEEHGVGDGEHAEEGSQNQLDADRSDAAEDVSGTDAGG